MRISVCLASYNGEKYIKEQINSILSQLKQDDELIISDDGSSDKTIAVVNDIVDPRVKLINNLGERGYTRNFENALKEAQGDIIFLSDQDDVWVDHKVETMLKQLESSDMVISNAMIVDEQLNVLNHSHFDLHKVRKGFWNNFLKTRYIGACMAFKRNVLTKALPFPKYQEYCAHDYWLAIIGEAYFKVEIVDKPLLFYRRHDKNASSGGEISRNSFFKKVFIRFYCILNLLGRRFKN